MGGIYLESIWDLKTKLENSAVLAVQFSETFGITFISNSIVTHERISSSTGIIEPFDQHGNESPIHLRVLTGK
jgi:hypothetical protein